MNGTLERIIQVLDLVNGNGIREDSSKQFPDVLPTLQYTAI